MPALRPGLLTSTAPLPTALLLLVVGLVSWFGAAPASAHTVLGGSTPSADEVVRAADVIELRFTGPVREDGAGFSLRASSGGAQAFSAPELAEDRTSVTFRPVAALPDDRYRVGYEVLAFDGHPEAGFVEFEVSRDGVARAAAWPAEDTAAPVAPQPEQQDVAPDGSRPWVLAAAGAAFVLLTVVLLRLDRPARRDASGS